MSYKIDSTSDVWKDVAGYEGNYEVSSVGKIRNSKGKNLSICISRGGYCVVRLCREKGAQLKYVHRLVAEAFLPNPNNLPCINHKDENKKNNEVSNLEWCDHKYNNNYGLQTQHKKKPVILKNDNGEEQECESMTKASELLGVTVGAISQAITYGFICKGYTITKK